MPAAAKPTIEPVTPHRTILLVDDDRTTLQVLRKMLQQQGYTVLFAADSETALKLFQLHSHPIDLLLCDIVMPHLSGPQLAERIRTVRPTVPVLFISGLMQETAVQDWLRSGAKFLRKPVSHEQLAEKVQELIAPVIGSA
jgi:two-component system cell cycle sensor histidine kinase/response regulator CckA